jgi:hypothetical protein
MDSMILTSLDGLRSGQREQQDAAYRHLMAITDTAVPWAYDIWEEVVTLLAHPNNRTRAIAAQLLCNLAKSDPQARIL